MSGTSPLTILHARPSAIAVLPTPASPTNRGLFLRRRHSTWITRSTSLSRPINGSIFPWRASTLRFCVYWSSGLSLPVDAASSVSCAGSAGFTCSVWSLRTPWLIKFTTSKRVTPCCCKKYTACESFSPKMATNTLAPVTSFLPFDVDCTCMMARWITRWNPSVGCVSTSSLPGTTGVLSLIKFLSCARNSAILTAQAFNTSTAVALSSSDASKCSTVINSCRAALASTNAICKLTSNSWAIMLPP